MEAKKVFGRFILSTLRAEDITRWMKATVGRPRVSRRKEGGPQKDRDGNVLTVTPATINRVYQALNAAINHGIKTDFIRGVKNPCSMVKALAENNTRDIDVTQAQFESLVHYLPGHLKPIVLFAYFTGARQREILNLKKVDVDLFKEVVFIRDTKNDESRYVPLAPELKETLIQLIKTHPESPFLFNHGNGQPVKWVRKGFRTACRRAELDNLHFHDLRHVALSRWAAEGHSHFAIMAISGHKTMSAFQRYLSFKLEDLKRVVSGKDGDNLETGRVVEIAKAM